MVDTDKLDKQEKKNLKKELKTMQKLNHPHIVKYLEAYEDSGKMYFVMELCKGGELQ